MIPNQKLKQFHKILQEVKSFGPEMHALTDLELQTKTLEFKERLKAGESLESLLPEAYAVICEADGRILGKFPYEVQILGGIALHYGYLAEMNTGEGKTLVATLPLYLNALTGRSNILVTTNDYLAKRDADEMGKVYRFLGLSCMAQVNDNPARPYTSQQKRRIYSSDIVYTTHSTLGFDYLFHNLAKTKAERFLREFYFVIVDEADSVLLDAAQTPLVISGAPRVQSNLYPMADFFVTTLVEGEDYEKEEKKVWLTEKGVAEAERYFQIENFYDKAYYELHRHVILALRAHALFQKEKEYMVNDQQELVLLDHGTGRMLPGVKLRGGQHQAIEQKEKLPLTKDNRSIASITYQNLFLLFPKMAGMSGTIRDNQEELKEIYGKDVIAIPSNKEVQRQDLPDQFFETKEESICAAIDKALELHQSGQPVLIVVSTIAETEAVAERFVQEGIPHNVLNASNAYWEASIIKEAGQKGAVTIATSMAGRGTDIKLGQGVGELGGLAVIGIGRMENTRLERQARGRSGRQGDPGLSIFYVSLEDETVVNYSTGHPGKGNWKAYCNRAQSLCQEMGQSSRAQAFDYDRVMQRQRQIIYHRRKQILNGSYFEKTFPWNYWEEELTLSRDYENKKSAFSNKERKQQFYQAALLRAIDQAWVEQVDYLQQLQTAVKGRSSAQRNPLFEFEQEAMLTFQKMEKNIQEATERNIMESQVYLDVRKRAHIIFPL